jgi:hypothetical protein
MRMIRYKFLSKLKTYVGVIVLVLHFMNIEEVRVGYIWLWLALILLYWMAAEELLIFIKARDGKYSVLRLVVDLSLETVVAIYLLRHAQAVTSIHEIILALGIVVIVILLWSLNLIRFYKIYFK